MSTIRKPTAAGFFYPSNSVKLQQEIDLLLSETKPETNIKNITGIVSPHAGYIYSGRTAAFAYNLLKDKEYKNIFIISPSHREYFPGVSVYNGDGYETPLGTIPVNQQMVDKLTSNSKLIFKGIAGHRDEHAIEVQIPFLQSVLKDFTIIPIVMGDQKKIFVDELANKLSEIIDDSSLMVASSDLSHYHSKEDAFELDSIVEKRISDFDFDRLQIELEERTCEACGGGPIVAIMKAASLLNKKKSIVLNRSDSGDTSGDNSEVVGYLSAAIYGE